MQIAGAATISGGARREGVPVITVAGVDRARNEAAPMTVYARQNIGRDEGYGSLPSALAAARNLSRGTERAAVVVERGSSGAYQVREAVWRYLHGRNQPPADRAPFRHFHFEDGTFSAYTAWLAGRKIEVTAQDYYRAYDGVTRWLVDGRRVLEVTPEGGTGR